jgi:transposase InsO family protein
VIEKLSSRYPVTLLLKVAEINRSGYYRWLNKRMFMSEKSKEDAQVIKCIKKLYIKHYGRYGVERMTAALLADYGLEFNHKKIYRLMSQNGYLAVIKAKKQYRKPGDPHPKKNVLVRNFSTSCPFDKMVTDVTEYKIDGKKIYISVVKDLYTGMLEGFSVKNYQTRELIRESFKNILDKSLPEGTIIHSDQGTLYNNIRFQNELKDRNFIQSMSRKGTPIDNSPMESFFGCYKSEVLYNPNINILSKDDFMRETWEYYHYYNNVRIQKRLGYLTPAEFKEHELIRIEREKE